jgi:hypothetical protein
MTRPADLLPPWMNETTPSQITDEIIQFCEAIAPGQKPIFVPVTPVPNARTNHCHPNVAAQVELCGGTAVYGWIIWQGRAFLDAEFHCNWLSSEGVLIDITPHPDGERRILFLPDPQSKWDGYVVPSRRCARLDIPVLHDLLRAMEESEKLASQFLPGVPIVGPAKDRIIQLNLKAARLIVELCSHFARDEQHRKRRDDRDRRKAIRKAKKREKRRRR